MSALPEYLVMIFVEEEVDKRSRMYKAAQKNGRVTEFATQNQDTLMRWILGNLKKENRKITRTDMELFLEKNGGQIWDLSARNWKNC